tara:strand:+ start:87 stop:1112 length:1026 start_codon:yes stop_codon:yes gene_type:complete
MKNLLSILILSIFPFSLSGESFETFYEDGSLKMMGETSNLQDGDGWFLGNWKEFFIGGEVTREGSYKYNKEIYKFYNEKERLIREGRGIDGVAEGEWIFYLNNGAIKEKGTLSKDKRYGLWTAYYEDGSLYAETNFVLDKIDGRHKTYHRNNTLCSNNLFENGKLIGSAKKFYDNGQIEYEQAYVDGIKHGLGVRVDTDGKYLWITRYEEGKILDEETRARNKFLFREIDKTTPYCNRYLQPIDSPKGPDYPQAALRREKEGCVLLDFTINEEGRTEDIKVDWSVPKRIFDKSAMKYVSKLVYPKPKDNKGLPSTSESKLIIKFIMSERKYDLDYNPPDCE